MRSTGAVVLLYLSRVGELLVFIPLGERSAEAFVNRIYEGELLGFMGVVVTVILLEGPEGTPTLMEDGVPIHTPHVS